MEKLGLTVPAVDGVGTIVHVAVEGATRLSADFGRSKAHSADAIRALKASGVRKTVMLTGDAQPVAQAVAQQLGLDEYHAAARRQGGPDRKAACRKAAQGEPCLCG